MSNPGESDPTPITSARQLAEWFAAGSKPRAQWRIGTEHEKFGFRREDLAPPLSLLHDGGALPLLDDHDDRRHDEADDEQRAPQELGLKRADAGGRRAHRSSQILRRGM